MGSKAFVRLALDSLKCTQKDLATRLGVSPTQINKWKNGEHISWEMEAKFREILNIGDKDPSVILWAGSLDDAEKWENLIQYLAKSALEEAETGYNTYPLVDEDNLLSWRTIYTLEEMGIAKPGPFPKNLDMDYKKTNNENLWEILENNQYTSLIYRIYKSLNNLYGFYAAYISELVDDDELDIYDVGNEVEACLMSLAACKIEIDQSFATRLQEFKYETKKDYEKWLNIIKEKAFRSGVPLRAEILKLIYGDEDKLGHEAEAESLGFNASKLHPDIYMNELLVGMRIIHQVLPAILEKLGIEKELDISDLIIK